MRGCLKKDLKTSGDFAQRLLEEEHTVVTDGAGFGAEGFIRISYATSMEQIQEGIEANQALRREILSRKHTNKPQIYAIICVICGWIFLVQVEVVFQLHPHRDLMPVLRCRHELDLTCRCNRSLSQTIRQTRNGPDVLSPAV